MALEGHEQRGVLWPGCRNRSSTVGSQGSPTPCLTPWEISLRPHLRAYLFLSSLGRQTATRCHQALDAAGGRPGSCTLQAVLLSRTCCLAGHAAGGWPLSTLSIAHQRFVKSALTLCAAWPDILLAVGRSALFQSPYAAWHYTLSALACPSVF